MAHHHIDIEREERQFEIQVSSTMIQNAIYPHKPKYNFDVHLIRSHLGNAPSSQHTQDRIAGTQLT